MNIFEILTVLNTVLIGILYYFVVFKPRVKVTDTDIMRIISLVGSLFQVIKTTYNNPNDTRIQFIEKLLEEIKKSFEEKNQK